MTIKDMIPCPFCGGNARVNYKDTKFLGQRYDGVKKIRYRAYGVCNKCHARSEPVFAVIDDVGNRGWSRRMIEQLEPMAIEKWNRRMNNAL